MERIHDLAVADLFSKRLQKMGVRFRLFIDLIDLIDLKVITASHIRFIPQIDAKVLLEEFENDELKNKDPKSWCLRAGGG